MRKRVLTCSQVAFFLVAFTFATPLKGQSLHPDSLLIKVEQLGNYFLYRNHDTSYIENYSDSFIFKLIGVNKYNYFRVKDSGANTSARFRPDRRLNLGFGISYKWFAFDLAFNTGIEEDSDFQNSELIDLSATIFSSKQFISATYQYYYGYQMSKVSGISVDKLPDSPIRDDIRTVYFGLQYYFVFDYDKYSLKSSFIHNERQKKSAGSFLVGAGFGYYNLAADSTVIPSEFHEDFDERLHFTDVNASNLGVGIGYIYTLVWKKHFYATVSFIPGIGLNFGDYKTEFRKPYNTHLYLGFKTMNSIGYNAKQLFGGIQFTNDLFKTRIEKKLNIFTGHGKAKIFIGYRFG
jgi:hypothetical protein